MAEMQATRPNQHSDYTYPSHNGPSYPQPPPKYFHAPSNSSMPPPQYAYPATGTLIAAPQHTYTPSVPTIPPSPPQPQHSHVVTSHTPPNQASSASKTVCNIISAIVLFLGIIVATIFIARSFLESKSFIRFNVISAELNQLDLSRENYSSLAPFTHTSPFNYLLDYNLVLSYTLRNSYKIGVRYDLINVTAYYAPNSLELLGLNQSHIYQPFYASPKSDVTYSNVTYEGYGGYTIIFSTDDYFNAAPVGGPFSFYVRMKVNVTYSSDFLNFFLRESWDLWQCLEIPLSSSTYLSSYGAFQLTECVNVKNFKG